MGPCEMLNEDVGAEEFEGLTLNISLADKIKWIKQNSNRLSHI